MQNTTISYSNSLIPFSMISNEIGGLYGSKLLKEMGEIIDYYKIYESGAEFKTDGSIGYIPSDLRYKQTRTLIDKEARFLFSNKPDILIESDGTVKSDEEREQNQKKLSVLQRFVDNVFQSNNISRKLLQAARDCFIGKRVALIAGFNDEGIAINFLPSLEFVFDVDELNVDKITKLVAFYTLNDNKSREEQRIYKKKYWLENNVCYYNEGLYNGVGQLIEEIQPDTKTLFSYIPATVIINDGLTGDINGVSEVELLADYEMFYSRLSNSDIDAERKSMHPITYTVDMEPSTTKGLSRAPGAYWDLTSNQNLVDSSSGQVGTLENSMSYSGSLDVTLQRIRKNMYQQIDMPEIDELQSQLSSGKALKSIYWGLIVRSNEKMQSWKAALQFITRTIIEGGILYPNSRLKYIDEPLPIWDYDVKVDNQYPLPEDEIEEIGSDLSKVAAQTMSRKRFIKKWEGLTDEEADEELEQIALEREILENSYQGEAVPQEQDDELDEELDDLAVEDLDLDAEDELLMNELNALEESLNG